MDKIGIGQKGEDMALDFLLKKGFIIHERNYRKRSGEIDIIAFDPKYEEYVFTEVKTRTNMSFGYPEEAVDDEKIEKIVETAESWLAEMEIKDPEWRIDIISILLDRKGVKIDHIENVS